MRATVLPTVARTMSIGEPIVNHFTISWNCQYNHALGTEVFSISVAALSSSKLVALSAAAAVVLVEPDIVVVVLPSFCLERVTFEKLPDDDSVTSVRNSSSRQ